MPRRSRKGKFKVTGREVSLAVALGLIGFLGSSRQFILYLNGLTPIQGLALYYVILYAALYLFGRLGLAVAGIRIRDPFQVLGGVLILFAFFTVTNFGESCLTSFYLTGACSVPSVYLQSEDGAVMFWLQTLGVTGVETLRLLTYVVVPFVLALVGTVLTTKAKLSPF